LSRVETEQKFQSAFFAGTTGLEPTAAGLRPFTYNINFAPGASGNPFSTPARYQGVFQDMGTRDNKITSDTARILVGLKYAFAGWDGDSAIGWSRNEAETLNINRITNSGTGAVFGVPTTPQPPVPTSTGSAYNLDRWTTIWAAVRDQLLISFPRKA
jgi:iron complex outermembrane receptor protein